MSSIVYTLREGIESSSGIGFKRFEDFKNRIEHYLLLTLALIFSTIIRYIIRKRDEEDKV